MTQIRCIFSRVYETWYSLRYFYVYISLQNLIDYFSLQKYWIPVFQKHLLFLWIASIRPLLRENTSKTISEQDFIVTTYKITLPVYLHLQFHINLIFYSRPTNGMLVKWELSCSREKNKYIRNDLVML